MAGPPLAVGSPSEYEVSLWPWDAPPQTVGLSSTARSLSQTWDLVVNSFFQCPLSQYVTTTFLKKIYFLFLAVLGLRCCAQAFSSCGQRRSLLVVVRGLLIAAASLIAEHGL